MQGFFAPLEEVPCTQKTTSTHTRGTVTVENTGLSGVVVRLSGVSDASATTDASGRYSFTGLRMGNYSVEISGFDSDAVGFSSTASSTSVGVGESKIVSFDGTYLRTAGVSGQVSVEGEGLNGVMVSLRGGPDNVDESTTTDAAGQYAFASLRAGTYTVGISGWDDTDFEFEVTSKSVTVALGETGYVEFEGELLRTSGLAGRVSVGGMGMAGITVTLSGTADATANTDASGIYAFAGLAAGDYTVTISGYDAVEYSFDDSQDVTLEMDKTAIVNFDGMALRTASIKVMVTADGAGVAGVAATLTLVTSLNPPSGTIVGAGATDADGMHTFGPLLAGNYRVDISGADAEIEFERTSWQGPVATGAMAEANFAGTINRTGSIAGMVTADGEGMGGVTVTLGGAGDASMMTADDGSYSFTGLRRGDYTVSIANPDDAMYSFPTTSRDVSVAIGQMHTDVSFAGTMIRRGSISGQVSVEGMGLDSVTVTLSGAHDATTMTDASGQYAFSGLGGGAYTVSMTNPSEVKYTFEHTSADVMIGNAESTVQNFTGMHTRTASISGMLYVDEAEKNDMYDDGEDMLAAAGVELALIGPSIAERQTGSTGDDGSFSFGELRAGSYQLVVSANAEVPMDYGYGGPATGYDVMVDAGEAAMQNVPFDITHQTVAFSVTLRAGDDTGPAVEGATVNLYADEDRDDMVGSGMTDDMGMASIRFARADTEGHMVYAAVMAPEGDYAVADGMQMVSWDGKDKMASAANSGNIVNLAANVTFGGATRMTEYGGGKPLAGWGVDVLMTGDDDKKAVVEGAPTKLDDDGMAAFMTTAESDDDLPMTYYFALDADQANAMDGGEKYMGDTLMYTHTGLTMGAQDAGMITAQYTTQTLKVYVHHEMDQIEGYSGNILGGDKRTHAGIDVNIRYIADNGRSRIFAAEDWAKGRSTYSASNGVVTFSHVPADAKVIVQAKKATTGAGNIMLMEPDELSAYDEREEYGAMGGSFGAEGGFHHTMELCPLTSEANNQDGMLCSSFAFVNTYNVSGLVWKRDVKMTGLDAFTDILDPVRVPDRTVSLNPVDGKNLAGIEHSQTTRTSNPNTTAWDDRVAFNFGAIAAGVYDLSIPAGWRARLGDKAAEGSATAVSTALTPLGDDIMIDVTPATGILYGRVTGSGGFPLDSVTVTVNGKSTVTDEFGRYIIRDYGNGQTRNSEHAGKLFMSVAAPGFDTKSNDPDYRAGGVRGSFSITHADGTHPEFAANMPVKLDIPLEGTALTTLFDGSVTHNGSPVDGASIMVDYGDGRVPPENAVDHDRNPETPKVLLTGSDGTFSARVQAGPQTSPKNVTVTATKYGLTVEPFDGVTYTAIVGQPSPNLTFTAFANATIRARVVLNDAEGGGPVAGVKVTAKTARSDDKKTTGQTGTVILSASAGTVTVAAESDAYTLAFANDKNTIDVYYGQKVTLPDITATTTVDPPSTDATLSALTLSAGTLDPTFDGGKTAYEAEVARDVERVTVTATATRSDDGAEVEIEPVDVDGDDRNGHQVAIEAGESETITVTVTAPDENTTKKYTVVVRRAGDIPTAPQQVEATSPGSGQLMVTWRSPAYGGKDGVSSYEVKIGNADWAAADGNVPGGGSHSFSGLIDGRINTIKVRAVMGTGNGAVPGMPSASIMARSWPTISTAVFDPPSIAEGDEDSTTDTKENESTLTITMSNASRTAVHVKVEVADEDHADLVTFSEMATVPAEQSSVEIKVTAVDNDEDAAGGAASTDVTFNVTMMHAEAEDRAATPSDLTITDDDEVPGAPTNVAAEVGNGQLTVVWTAPSNIGSSPITGYQYRYKKTEEADATYTKWDDTGTANTHTITDLDNDTEYTVQVRAVSAAGAGATGEATGTPAG